MGLSLGYISAYVGYPDPLVLYHQLPHDSLIPIRHGCYDHDAHSPERYLEIQPAGKRGRSSRRDWMEAGSRRRIQAPDKIRPAVCLRGHGCAVFRDGRGDDAICPTRISVPC